MRVFLLVAFPLLTHLAVLFDSTGLEWLALSVLAAAVLCGPLLRGAAWSYAALGLVSLAAALAVHAGAGRYALVLPSLAVPTAIGLLFGSSLLPGRTPLVARYAALLHEGALSAELQRYTRAVTALWTATALALLLCSLWLLQGPPARWSAFANGYSYALLGAVFVLEYAYRRWHFRHEPQPGVAAYVKLLSTQRPGSL